MAWPTRYTAGLFSFLLLLLLAAPVALAGPHCGAEGDWRSGVIPDVWPPPQARSGYLNRFGVVRNVAVSRACMAHDKCYDTLGRGRSQCDEAFKRDICAECDRAYPDLLDTPMRNACYAAAEGYYQAVVEYGAPAYAAAQAKARARQGAVAAPAAAGEHAAKPAACGAEQDADLPCDWQQLCDAPQGTAGLASVGGILYAWVPGSSTIWSRRMGQGQWKQHCECPKGDLFTGGNGRLYIHDSLSGYLWEGMAAKPQWSCLCTVRGIDLLAAWGGKLVVRRKDGGLRWSRSHKVQWQDGGDMPASSAMALLNGRVYRLDPQRLVVLRAALGRTRWEPLWRVRFPGPLVLLPGSVLLLDPDGGSIWSQSLR